VTDPVTEHGVTEHSASEQGVTLSRGTGAVPEARRHVRRVLPDSPALEDLELVVTELVTNAVLHTHEGEVELRLVELVEAVRVEVEDAGHGMPVAVRESTEAMTGRGLALVAALSQAWGVESGRPGHKVVWAEVPLVPSSLERIEPDIDVDAFLAEWADDDVEETFEVRLGSVPTELLLAAKAHVDNLVRELTLASEGELPAHFATLVPAVVQGFAEARVSIKEQALAAAALGQAETELVLTLRAQAALAGEAYLAALDELDRYAGDARLLTLASPPVHRVFRHWYVQAIVDQLRARALGEVPPPVLTFPARLAEEVTELATLRPTVERSSGLYEVASALAALTTPVEVAEAVVRSGRAVLGAYAGGLLARSPEGLRVLSAEGFAPSYLEMLEAAARDAADLPGPVVLRTGEPLWLESAEQRDALFPGLSRLEPHTVSTCLVPLVAGERLGVLRFSFDIPRLFDEGERRYVLALADQAALALQRSELFLAERQSRREAELLARRLDGLRSVVGQLTTATTEEEIAELAVSSATTHLGATAARLHLLGSDGMLHSRAASSGVPELTGQYVAVDPTDPALPAHEALRTGRPLVLGSLEQIAERYPALARLYASDRSLMLAPLIVDTHRLGVLSVTFAPEQDADGQRSFVTSLADAAAQALERVDARGRAQAANERLRFLAQASVLLSGSLDVNETLSTVADLVVPQLADWCSIQLVDETGLATVALAHADPSKVAWAVEMQERYPPDLESSGAARVVRTGETELYTDISAELLRQSARDEEHLRLIQGVGMQSALVVPLAGRARPLGAITMIMADSSRRFGEEDVRFAEDLARRAALAVETVTAFAAQEGRLEAVTRVADAAQRAILPSPPAAIGGLSLAARYVSATAEALVGGDLYEVVRRPGAVRLLIGDVRGKGLEAVRNATIVLGEFRAAAEDIDDLVAVAVQLDRRLSGHLDLEDFVTALVAEIADDGAFTLVSCGHPPALLISAAGIVTVDVPFALPLGLGTAPFSVTGRLEPGDRLLLYTDGLVEARGAEGAFPDVTALVQPLRTEADLGKALDGVLDAVGAWTGDGLGDDLALLAVERPH
jgi:serine phosphatase RsbU (regulator of sigma subunit)/anti-sigma regulatory factor (Ser/Thr protein kinase)